jgi:hypothetical protein
MKKIRVKRSRRVTIVDIVDIEASGEPIMVERAVKCQDEAGIGLPWARESETSETYDRATYDAEEVSDATVSEEKLLEALNGE